MVGCLKDQEERARIEKNCNEYGNYVFFERVFENRIEMLGRKEMDHGEYFLISVFAVPDLISIHPPYPYSYRYSYHKHKPGSQIKLQNGNRVRSISILAQIPSLSSFLLEKIYSRHIPNPIPLSTWLRTRTRQIQRLWSDSRSISQVIERVWICVCQDRAIDVFPSPLDRHGEGDGG